MLTFNAHIDFLLNITSRKLGVLCEVHKCMNQLTALTLYKSVVLPDFDYCDIIYCCTSQENLHKLQLIQTFDFDFVTLTFDFDFDFWDQHTADLHQDLNIDMLYVYRDLYIANSCHQNIYFDEYASLSHYFVALCGRLTRAVTNNTLKVPRGKTSLMTRSFSVRGPTLWNQSQSQSQSQSQGLKWDFVCAEAFPRIRH